MKTVFQINTLLLFSTPADPWNGITSTIDLLFALADYWHANYASVPRTTVHMLSGKKLGGGSAWQGSLCENDWPFESGGVTHYGGSYGVSTNLAGSFSTTTPSLYWDIYCFTHEIGHSFDSPHTHCYLPTPEENERE